MNNQPEYDVVARRGGVGATVLYLVVIVLAMWLVRCDTAPMSEEEMSQGSILISFGDSDEGSGEVEMEQEQEVAQQMEREPTPEPTPEAEVEPTPEPVAEQILTDETSDIEQEMPAEETPPPPPAEEVVEQPREVNQRALFPGTTTTEPSQQSQGDDQTPKGVVGTERGNDKSEAELGGGLSGDFNLAGRSLMGSLPVPQYNEQQEGRVVINITVDETGRVTSASLRATNSTTNNSTLIAAAREAALKARFSPSDSFVQSGTITYIFKLN